MNAVAQPQVAEGLWSCIITRFLWSKSHDVCSCCTCEAVSVLPNSVIWRSLWVRLVCLVPDGWRWRKKTYNFSGAIALLFLPLTLLSMCWGIGGSWGLTWWVWGYVWRMFCISKVWTVELEGTSTGMRDDWRGCSMWVSLKRLWNDCTYRTVLACSFNDSFDIVSVGYVRIRYVHQQWN